MPDHEQSATNPSDDLEIAARIMQTVSRQVGAYHEALEKLRELRKEVAGDEALAKRVGESPAAMTDVLTERGIPLALAAGMAAEDHKKKPASTRDEIAMMEMWTWDCCCTACCLTLPPCTVIVTW